MAKGEKVLQVGANKGKQHVELVGLIDGAAHYEIAFTIEQAVKHVQGIIAAIDIIQGTDNASKAKLASSLILPPGYQS